MSSITYTPIPSVKEFWTAATHSVLNDDILARQWCRFDEFGIWFSRSAWSLRVIAEWRIRCSGNNLINVWIPDFFCNASLKPLRELGVKIIFYRITDKLAPEMEWCYSHSLIEKPDIFVLVHFFGQVSPAANVAELCKNLNALFIEDATHVLKPIPGVGEHGDFIMYSPHKHLAIPDGALLVVRNCGPSMLGNSLSSLIILRDVCLNAIKESPNSSFSLFIWVMKRILQLLGIQGRKLDTSFWPDIDYSSQYCKYVKMSSLARRFLSAQQNSLDMIGQIRKKNKKIWERTFFENESSIKEIEPWPMNETPYLAAFIVEDFKRIEYIFKLFISNRLPVTSWPDLPPEVLENPDQHKIAIHIRRTRIYLHVHQTLAFRKILEICTPLKSILTNETFSREFTKND
jgi:dTDP-4-amino-4,6-dideoxygalactose transaminase